MRLGFKTNANLCLASVHLTFLEAEIHKSIVNLEPQKITQSNLSLSLNAEPSWVIKIEMNDGSEPVKMMSFTWSN